VDLNQVKKVRLHYQPRPLVTAKRLALDAGVLLLAVDIINNTIVFKRDEIINPKVGIVSLCFLATALVLEEVSIKRIRINSRNSLKIIDENYFQFNQNTPANNSN
jgi:hypothetical protein